MSNNIYHVCVEEEIDGRVLGSGRLRWKELSIETNFNKRVSSSNFAIED